MAGWADIPIKSQLTILQGARAAHLLSRRRKPCGNIEELAYLCDLFRNINNLIKQLPATSADLKSDDFWQKHEVAAHDKLAILKAMEAATEGLLLMPMDRRQQMLNKQTPQWFLDDALKADLYWVRHEIEEAGAA